MTLAAPYASRDRERSQTPRKQAKSDADYSGKWPRLTQRARTAPVGARENERPV
jgi:hypothetical protein